MLHSADPISLTFTLRWKNNKLLYYNCTTDTCDSDTWVVLLLGPLEVHLKNSKFSNNCLTIRISDHKETDHMPYKHNIFQRVWAPYCELGYENPLSIHQKALGVQIMNLDIDLSESSSQRLNRVTPPVVK